MQVPYQSRPGLRIHQAFFPSLGTTQREMHMLRLSTLLEGPSNLGWEHRQRQKWGGSIAASQDPERLSSSNHVPVVIWGTWLWSLKADLCNVSYFGKSGRVEKRHNLLIYHQIHYQLADRFAPVPWEDGLSTGLGHWSCSVCHHLEGLAGWARRSGAWAFQRLITFYKEMELVHHLLEYSISRLLTSGIHDRMQSCSMVVNWVSVNEVVTMAREKSARLRLIVCEYVSTRTSTRVISARRPWLHSMYYALVLESCKRRVETGSEISFSN